MKIRFAASMIIVAMFAFCGFAYAAGYTETFSEANGALAGTTTDTGGYTWTSVNPNNPTGPTAVIDNGVMKSQTVGVQGVEYSWAQGFQVADFNMTFDVNISGLNGDGSWGGVQYRATNTNEWPAGGGYLLMLRGYPSDGHGDMWLFGGPTAQVGTSAGWHSVQVQVVGASHKIWWDGALKIDTVVGGPTTAGNIQFMECNSTDTNTILFDNINVESVPEPSSLLALLAPCLGLAVTRFRRR